MTSRRLPSYFISHGGGPWPWLKKESKGAFDVLESSLKEIRAQIERASGDGSAPRAILVVSGHWEADRFTLMTSPKPPMVYDYSGFPEHTYSIRYEAPGSPEVAERARQLLEEAGIEAGTDAEQGFDHGTFAPLYAMYPDASVPVLQLSMKSGYSVSEHLRAGEALAPLRDEGVLILGSGLSYHNLRRFGPQAREVSQRFDHWLQSALAERDPERRAKLLEGWESAPCARDAHPREDHLVPLFVALGAARSEPARLVYHEEAFMGGVAASSYRFG